MRAKIPCIFLNTGSLYTIHMKKSRLFREFVHFRRSSKRGKIGKNAVSSVIFYASGAVFMNEKTNFILKYKTVFSVIIGLFAIFEISGAKNNIENIIK